MSGSRTGLVAATPSGTRDSSYLDTFANQIRLGATISDFTIIFGVNDDLGHGEVVMKDVAAIHLAPVTLKLLALNIQTTIDAYEKSVGAIPVPATLVTHLEKQTEMLTQMLHDLMQGGKATRP